MSIRAKHRVYISEIGDLKSTLQSGLEFIQWQRHINKDTRVFVKPNFTFPCYKEGITTSPELLRSLLQLLKTRTDHVTVGESDGGNHSFTAEQSFHGHDMYRICEETGAQLVSLSRLPAEEVEGDILGKKVRVKLPGLLLRETDCFISVPVLKTHVMTTVTLSLKNLWGCVPETMRCVQHRDLVYKLALIARSIRPRIAIVDGIYALDRHGPMYGDAVRTNLLIAADNPVAADSIGARVMGFAPENLKSISVAARSGLGSMKPEDIEVSQNWQAFQRHFRVQKTLIDRVSMIFFYSDALARLAMASPLTPVVYCLARPFKSRPEREVSDQIARHRHEGP